jgi:flavin reductase (NADH)
MTRRPIQAGISSQAAGDATESERLQQQVRDAFAHWASGVAVIAARHGGTLDAITVTSFSTVSLAPPLLLACMGEQAAPLPLIRAGGRFTLSILAQAQRRAASVIADRMPGRQSLFSDGEPAVLGALVAFDCVLRNDYDGGDHRILVGAIERVSFGDHAEPLLYVQRGYRALG